MENKMETAMRVKFEEIYTDYSRKIYNYVYVRLLNRESAEEVTTEIFTKLPENLKSNAVEKSAVGKWIGTIARNAVNDYVKKAKYRQEKLPDEEPYNILIKLTEEDRDFMGLRYCLELKNQEIGEIMCISAESVEKRIKIILEKCRGIDEGREKNVLTKEEHKLNKKAEIFKKYLEEKKIEVFEVEELKDEQDTTVFSSQIMVSGQRLPTLVILDKSVFALIRVQIAPQVLTEENRTTLLSFINEENLEYKPFKFYFNKSGTLFLDLSIPTEEKISGEMIYLMFNVIINYLESGYKKIMQKIWQ